MGSVIIAGRGSFGRRWLSLAVSLLRVRISRRASIGMASITGHIILRFTGVKTLNAICVIPAKKTSKRLPGKNSKLFYGRPVIEYSIDTALKSDCFDEVIVASDSEEIWEIAERCGATAFTRSVESCGDDVPMIEPVIEVLQSKPADYVCMAYACAPFIKPAWIRQAHEYVTSGQYDSAFPGYRAEAPERVLIRRRDWFISRYPEYDNVNSQHFPYSYHIAGQFFFCDAGMVERYETVMLPRCWLIEVPKWSAVDIDTEEDWQMAEMLYGMKQ